MSLRNGAKRTAMETSSRASWASWASWMDDRTTTAYSPRAHPMIPRVATPADGRLLRSAPLPSANVRSDEAGLIWLDEDDLLSVTGQSITTAHSSNGSVFTKCLLPALGLFVAVLFGHIVLAASGQATTVGPSGAKPPSNSRSHGTDAAPGAPEKAAPAADAAGSGESTPAGIATPAAQQEEAAPRDKNVRSHRQHYDDGAHGAGASVPSSGSDRGQQPSMLRINSRPWAQVTLDGNPLGNTPLFDVQVAPGAHTLRLDNPDFRLSKTIRLDVAPGDTVTRVVSLQE